MNYLMLLALQMTFLIVGYGADSMDHDKTLKQVMHIFHWENLKTKKFMSIQMHEGTILMR